MDCNITYRQKDKGWQFIISYKVNGKWKQKSKQGFKTKKEAKPAAEKMLSDLKKTLKYNSKIIKKDYDKITFKELCEEYLKYKSPYVEAGTIVQFRSALNKFESLYDKTVISIAKEDIEKDLNAFIERNLRRVTVSGYLTQLNAALKYYKEYYNPNYEIPNKFQLPKHAAKNKKALSKMELDNIFANFKEQANDYEYIIALLCGTCGLRFGEALGLTRDADIINEESMELIINKQWKKNKDGVWGFGKLKTPNSYRAVPLPKSTLDELKKYMNENETDETNRLIIKRQGTVRTNTFRRLKKYFGVSIHELRHTYTTLLIERGLDFKTVAGLIGDDVKQVIDTYSHVNDDMKKRSHKLISDFF